MFVTLMQTYFWHNRPFGTYYVSYSIQTRSYLSKEKKKLEYNGCLHFTGLNGDESGAESIDLAFIVIISLKDNAISAFKSQLQNEMDERKK